VDDETDGEHVDTLHREGMGKGGATEEREGAGTIFGDEDDSDDYGDD